MPPSVGPVIIIMPINKSYIDSALWRLVSKRTMNKHYKLSKTYLLENRSTDQRGIPSVWSTPHVRTGSQGWGRLGEHRTLLGTPAQVFAFPQRLPAKGDAKEWLGKVPQS